MNFVIQRFIWDIDYPSREKAFALQGRFSRLFSDAAAPIMEEVFSSRIPPDRVFHFETLSLDLGVLDASLIERDFPERFRAELSRVLFEKVGPAGGRLPPDEESLGERQLPGGASPTGPSSTGPLPSGTSPTGSLSSGSSPAGPLPSGTSPTGSLSSGSSPAGPVPSPAGNIPASGLSPAGHSLEAFEHFLLEGVLPWWASRQPADAPQQLLERLCSDLPGQLRPLLLQAGQLARVRRRLAYQFPDPALRATVELIAPGEGVFIGDYHQTLLRVQQETRWVPQETAGFALEVWLFILTFLLRDMAGQFNRRAFVRQTLGEIAAHHNVAYAELLSVFAEALHRTTARFHDQDALQRIIRELAGEAPPAPSADSTVAIDESVTVLAQLRLYLSDTSIVLDVPERRRLLATLIDRQPERLRKLLSDLGRAASVRERMTDVFEDAGLHLVVRLEEPVHAGFIIHYATYIAADRHLRAEPGSLRKVVWMLILGYLWNERGSVFNTRTFLERQLRGLADHHRMSYSGLLTLLVGDQAGEWNALEPTTLFHLLADLWRTYAASPEAREAGAAGDGLRNAAGAASDVAPRDGLREAPGEAGDVARSDVMDVARGSGGNVARGSGGNVARGSGGDVSRDLARDTSEAAGDEEREAGGEVRGGGADGARGAGRGMGDGVTGGHGEDVRPVASSEDAVPAEATGLVQALIKLLRGLGSAEGGLAQEMEAAARSGDAKEAWVKAWPVLRAIDIPYRQMITLPFDGARFVEAMAGWLAKRTGMEASEMIAGLAIAAAKDTGAAPALRYLLMALGPEGPRVRGVERLVGAWLGTAHEGDPRLESAIQGWMSKQQPGWDERTLAFVRDVRKLFLSVIPGTLEKDGFEAVFAECVQAFLGDRYGAKDPQSFMEALLAYLEARRFTRPALYRAMLVAVAETHRFSVEGAVFLPRFRAMIETRVARDNTATAAVGGAAGHAARDSAAADAAARMRRDTAEARVGQDEAGDAAAAAKARDEAARAAEREREEAMAVERRRAKKKLTNEGVYVHNAGMVLLHPLLATLFNMLGWLEKGQFKTRGDQERAVHLLEFVVWGERAAPALEQELMLNKLMCGLAIGEPVPLEVALTEAEMKLGEQMLSVMLQRWQKLGNTSIGGLRTAFLQRGGGLTETTDAWTLRVEQRGVDVLLPFLPWGWGMIKTSWMEKTLNVEWT